MAFTAYRTWVAGEVVTAAQFNEQIRDNGVDDRTAHGCKLKLNATVTATTATVHTVGGGTNPIGTWDEVDDTNAYHDTTTNPERITIPTGYGGVYFVHGQVQFASGASQRRAILIRKNATTTIAETNLSATRHHDGTGGSEWFSESGTLERMAAGDYFDMQVFQNSGANLSLNSGVTTALSAYLIGV